jgi:hypothetical protein
MLARWQIPWMRATLVVGRSREIPIPQIYRKKYAAAHRSIGPEIKAACVVAFVQLARWISPGTVNKIAPSFLDTGESLEILRLVVYRREPVIVAASTFPVVEHFDVVEHVPPGFVSAGVGSTGAFKGDEP